MSGLWSLSRVPPGGGVLISFHVSPSDAEGLNDLARIGDESRASLVRSLVNLGLFYFGAASGMEAPSGGETAKTGSTEGDSPAPKGDAQTAATPRTPPDYGGNDERA